MLVKLDHFPNFLGVIIKNIWVAIIHFCGFLRINLSHPVAPSLPHLKPSRTSTQIQPGEVAKPLKLGDFDGLVGGIQRENHRKTLLNPPVSKKSQKHFRGLFFFPYKSFWEHIISTIPTIFWGAEKDVSTFWKKQLQPPPFGFRSESFGQPRSVSWSPLQVNTLVNKYQVFRGH